MPDSYAEIESRIESLLNEARSLPPRQIRKFCFANDLPYKRVLNRLNGTPSRIGRAATHTRLDWAQDRVICTYLDNLDAIGLPATRRLLVQAANQILDRNRPDEEEEQPRIGPN